MNKIEFLTELKMRLGGLPQSDIDAAIDYYTEIIDESMDAGLSSIAAVSHLDSPEEIAKQIKETEVPRKKRENIHNKRESMYEKPRRTPRRRLHVWEWILICLGFPIWGTLLLAAGIVCLALIIIGIVLIILLYVLDLVLAAMAVAGVIVSPFTAMIHSSFPLLFMLLGLTFLCAGLSLLLFGGCKKITVETVRLCRYFFHRRRAKFHERRLAV